MKEKDFIRWSKFRKIGELKYILLFSVYFIIVTNIFTYTLSHNFTFNIIRILGNFILCGSIGAIFGKIIWKNYEKRYEDYISSNSKV
ncbi:MAG: hypothetical protein ACREV6_01490 [Clostridium sp.]|uniref:hypothetical protein n=1 Tax=Clostridium sp. TaxID=1506 RepID=UPI003D6D8CD1